MSPLNRTLLALVATNLAACGASAAPTLKLLGQVDDGPAKAEWVYARRGQKVVLRAQLRPDDPKAELRWFRIEPTSRALDNTTPSFHYEAIAYATHELEACRGQRECEADVRPRDFPKTAGLDGLGAMAFQVRARLGDGSEVATPGAESVERGGLSRQVFRVAIRRDDTYLGYLTELLNTPYIFGSDGPAGRHQADLLIGSDCADLAVYAARRAGKNVPYVSTWTIADHAPEVVKATAQSSSGELLDAKGQSIRITSAPGTAAAATTASARKAARPGDLVLFPNSRHVGVLWEDRPPVGVLDASDLMFHTCWSPPTVEAIGESRCASLPVRVLRFR